MILIIFKMIFWFKTIYDIIYFSNQMIGSPSGPQLTPGGQMSGPIRSIGMYI